jgi:AraC family transcriptional regulator, regulatory protein of adaptative response / DNA-3-methyladenine glycosylase II
MYDDRARCVAAVRSRDARFDGWFFTAVTTTGIDCRPSCPTATPRPEDLVFHPTPSPRRTSGCEHQINRLPRSEPAA